MLRHFAVPLTLVVLALMTSSFLHREAPSTDAPAVTTAHLLNIPNTISSGANAKPPTTALPANTRTFSELAQKAWDDLPRIQSIQGPGHNVDYTPPEILGFSPELGEISTRLKENPELIPQGTDFYRSCAGAEGVFDAVRAVCLRNLKYWSSRANPPITVDTENFPKEIATLANKLPAFR